MTSVERALSELVGDDALVAAGPDLQEYGADRTAGAWPIRPSAIGFPSSIAEVQAVVACCHVSGIAFLPTGGRTGLAGGACATKCEVVCSPSLMDRALDV